MKYKVGDKVLIDCGEEDDGSLGNGLIGEVVMVDEKAWVSKLFYAVKSSIGITWYYEEELTLQE